MERTMSELIQSDVGRESKRPAARPDGYRALILEKRHLAQFLSDALQESGLTTSTFDDDAGLLLALPRFRPHLIVLGTLGHGVDSVRVIERLSRVGYEGFILVVGPAAAPLTAAVQNLGRELGLRMLPLLPTPFSEDALRNAVAGIDTVVPANATIDLHDALRDDWLELWYQPKFELRSFTLQGAEALLRVRHPVAGILGPDRVIPHASMEDMLALSDFVVSRAVADWHWFVENHGPVESAINLPLAYLSDPASLALLVSRIPAHPTFNGLVVETNASELLGNLDAVSIASSTLRPFKIALSVDDLGAEWPELLDLGHDFPFAEIKVDRSIVADCCDDSRKRSACHRIIEFADAVGARTVAEGVQTRADFITVRELGFDAVQGFFAGRPMPRTKFLNRVLRKPLMLAGMH
jgi:EAL domain-containing protein (putative c-di-GMP-specific phosphodiesterase class I)